MIEIINTKYFGETLLVFNFEEKQVISGCWKWVPKGSKNLKVKKQKSKHTFKVIFYG